jgi:hypothetical protein
MVPALRLCLIPDTQNYCSSSPTGLSNPSIAEQNAGPEAAAYLVADIISLQPDFCIQLGDIADQAGSNNTDDEDADNKVTNPPKWSEYECIKKHIATPLKNAGIRVLWLTGNHDSYLDVENAFSRAEFLAEDFAYSAQNEINRWVVGKNDTEQRTALFQSGIGPICAVTGDYTIDSAGGTLDVDYMDANIGCGAGWPTIGASHAGSISIIYDSTEHYEVFLNAYGHFINGSALDAQFVTVTGGFTYANVFTNGQEAFYGCAFNDNPPRPPEWLIHTGVGHWTFVDIIPSLNSIYVQSRNSLDHIWNDHHCNYALSALRSTFALPFCTRFPAARGCDPTLVPDGVAPSAPGVLTAPNIGQNSIEVVWPAATDTVGVAQYLVERCTGVACSPTVVIGGTPGNILSHISTGLTATTTYGFRVRARDGSGNLGSYAATIYAATAVDVTPPTAPNITSVTPSGLALRVLWSPSTDTAGIERYEIERCAGVSCADFALVATKYFGEPLSYLDGTVVTDTSYTYRIRSFDNSGLNSAYGTTGTAVAQ